MNNLIKADDPRVLYLQGLGQAISNLTEKETDSCWFINGNENLRKAWIDDLHKKAMEVIKTIEK